MSPATRTAIRRRLLLWFHANARSLPWRETRDPYAIWISEVMLQQTQVVTVIPYFQRFLARFPTLTDLAHADEQDVLRLWEGLGYYRRARDLLRAAKQLHDEGHTTIPDDVDLVRALPGFGRYTTNAVLSQAFDRPLPILEANSTRVLCRLFGVADDPKESATKEKLWSLAEMLVPPQRAGDFNQGLMELGALVCSTNEPKCDACPLQRQCAAHQQGRQHEIPRRSIAPKIVAVDEVAIVVQRRGKLLLVQRPGEGRWARLWEFPHHPLNAGESHDDAAARLLRQLGVDANPTGAIGVIRHAVTRFRITLTCLGFEHRTGDVRSAGFADAKWVRLGDLPSYPLSTPQRRITKLLQTSLRKSS